MARSTEEAYVLCLVTEFQTWPAPRAQPLEAPVAAPVAVQHWAFHYWPLAGPDPGYFSPSRSSQSLCSDG
ncbi:hypothetical protein J6590_078459 [Homalodisca vitripennis]|nr:hypothetical protein J6590_078459 [Homalodisca vitripennis]